MKAIKGKITKISSFGFPDTTNDIYFYGIRSIECSEDGKLYLADQQAGSIRVFSLKTGSELFRIGKIGSGPGEFKTLGPMKIFHDKQLSVIDNTLRRCTIFSENGKLIRTISLERLTDDIDFINGTQLITSSFLLDQQFKPLRIISLKNNRILDEFGKIIEPKEGLLKLFNNNLLKNSARSMLSSFGMTNVVLLADNQSVLYSQRNPYILIRYDLKTKTIEQVNPSVGFDTQSGLDIQIIDRGSSMQMNNSGSALGIKNGWTHLLVPIISIDGQSNYLDCYSLSGVFSKRLIIPPLKKGLKVFGAAFKGNQELLLLVSNELHLNWVERFSIQL
ncbi:MAG: 6-bladed beta-propeller [bacterium]